MRIEIWRSLRLGLAVGLVCGAASLARAQPAPFVVDKPFPDRVLPEMTSGRPMSLADFRGKKVVLQVFASW